MKERGEAGMEAEKNVESIKINLKREKKKRKKGNYRILQTARKINKRWLNI